MTTKTFPAKEESLSDILAFVEDILDSFECSPKIQTTICIAIEEIFINIARYAYADGNGDVDLSVGFEQGSRTVTIRIADKGIPFNPLKKQEPDITLSAEDREIGGLGIFITKKTMDKVTYAYDNSKNVLTMIKIV